MSAQVCPMIFATECYAALHTRRRRDMFARPCAHSQRYVTGPPPLFLHHIAEGEGGLPMCASAQGGWTGSCPLCTQAKGGRKKVATLLHFHQRRKDRVPSPMHTNAGWKNKLPAAVRFSTGRGIGESPCAN